MRRRAVACVRLLAGDGGRSEAAARILELSPRSLRRWRQRWRQEHLALRARGRPPRHARRGERLDLLALLGACGPGLGVPTLREIFPGLARGEIVELTDRYRYAWKRRRTLLQARLRWTRAGVAWAADFSCPPTPVDNFYPRLLLARDLSSGFQLQAMPVLHEDGDRFRTSLKSLCRWYQAPLVVKVDLGSAFLAEETQALAAELGILLLYSPPRTPEYNGAIEAGNGWIKQRAQESSERAGRPGEWTCDDLERALQEANATARPLGRCGPTPAQLWRERTPIGEEERRQFLQTYRRRYARECSRRGLPWTTALERYEKASVDRVAISQALIEHGYLAMRKRRITAPFFRRRADSIR
jgi:transposase InsO family protein